MPVRARAGAVPSAMPVTTAQAGGTAPGPSVMEMVAVLGPSAPIGVKLTSKLQFAPIARVAAPVGQGNVAEGTIVKSGLATTGVVLGAFAFAVIMGVKATPVRLLMLKVLFTAPVGITTPELVPPTGRVRSMPTVWPVSVVSSDMGPLVFPRGSVMATLLGFPAGNAPV